MPAYLRHFPDRISRDGAPMDFSFKEVEDLDGYIFSVFNKIKKK